MANVVRENLEPATWRPGAARAALLPAVLLSLLAIDRARYLGGKVSTLDSEKLCTRSANQNIKIDCTARIEGWKHDIMVKQNVPCVINGGACGLPGRPVGEPYPAAQGRLQVLGNGTATLSCQFKNES